MELPDCTTCKRFLKETTYHPWFFNYMQKVCLRTRSVVNPVRHKNCVFHSDERPLTPEEETSLRVMQEEAQRRAEMNKHPKPGNADLKAAALIAACGGTTYI